MEKKNLEAKLRAIQDLKAERYIGTQQAWRYLKAIEALYSNPIRIAKDINEKLRKDLISEKLYYPATEENVFCLIEKLSEIGRLAFNLAFDIDTKYEDYEIKDKIIIQEILETRITGIQNETRELREHPLWQLGFALEPRSEADIVSAINFLYPMFNKTQYPEITNFDFGQTALKIALKDCPLSNKEKVLEELHIEASILNWDYILSRENLIKQREKIQRDYLAACLYLPDRINKIMRDQIDHRLERRREIIADFLLGFQEYFEDFNSYKSALDFSLDRINFLHIMNSSNRDNNNVSEELQAFLYIRDILMREKNFVERYLRS